MALRMYGNPLAYQWQCTECGEVSTTEVIEDNGNSCPHCVYLGVPLQVRPRSGIDKVRPTAYDLRLEERRRVRQAELQAQRDERERVTLERAKVEQERKERGEKRLKMRRIRAKLVE